MNGNNLHTGADIFTDFLKKHNVEVIFGYPGSGIVSLYKSLKRYIDEDKLKFILPHHEQSAVHMADGYYRSSGKLGVCILASGPSATNSITGIYTAYLDSIPLLVITGQKPYSTLKKEFFQEAPICDITKSITKKNYLINDVNSIHSIFNEAIKITLSGRKRPVLIDFPGNFLNEKANEIEKDDQGNDGIEQSISKEIMDKINYIFELIGDSKKPLFLCGGGVIQTDCCELINILSERTKIPVITTISGIGAISQLSKLSIGVLGRHSHPEANFIFDKSDLVIALGTNFDQIVTGEINSFVNNKKIIHIDIDPNELNKVFQSHVSVCCDLKIFIQGMIDNLDNYDSLYEHCDWLNEINNLKIKYNNLYLKTNECSLHPKEIMEAIYNIRNDAVIVADSGENKYWAFKFFKYSLPRQFICSVGAGTMGYGLPASIGAKIANPDKLIICIAGDGGFLMNCQELGTIARYNIPVKIFIINNCTLGAVKQTLIRIFNEIYSFATDLSNSVDFVKLAKAFGIEAVKVDKRKNIYSTVKKAILSKGPFLIEFMIDSNLQTLPYQFPDFKLTQMYE